MSDNKIYAGNKVIFGFYKKNKQPTMGDNHRIYIGLKFDNKMYRYGYITNKNIKLVPHFYIIKEPIVKCDFNEKYMCVATKEMSNLW